MLLIRHMEIDREIVKDGKVKREGHVVLALQQLHPSLQYF